MDFEEISRAAKIMKFLSESEGMSAEQKIVKLFLNNLKPEYEKKAEIITKYMEFENMAKKYKGEVLAQNAGKSFWQKNMINDLIKSFDGKRKLKLGMMLKVIELNEIMEKI